MTDPVKHCKLYKSEGCAHVDGFLCVYDTCDMRINYEKVGDDQGLQKKNSKSLESASENKFLK
jgi:hypothetical protein